MAAPVRPARALQRAAKRRVAASSVTPVAFAYERSLDPCVAAFSRLENTNCSEGDR